MGRSPCPQTITRDRGWLTPAATHHLYTEAVETPWFSAASR